MTPSRTFTRRIYLLALVLRLIPVLLTRHLGIGLDDMFQYDMLARSLASGNGYRWYAQADLAQLQPYVHFDLTSTNYDPIRGVATSFRAPLYPAFLALIYFLSGTGPTRFFVARLAQAIFLGAPLAPLTYAVACRLLKPIPETAEKTARLAALVIAAYPMLLIFPLGLGTENLFFLLLLASFYSLLTLTEKQQPAAYLLSGLLLALTALTRSVILPFVALAIVWVWLLPADPLAFPKPPSAIWQALSRRNTRGALLTLIAFTLAVLPWVIRNSLLHQRLTGIETSLGYNLYVGYHPQSNGTFTFGPSLDLLPILDDSLRDRLGTQKAIEFLQAAPARFWPLALSRLGHFFRLELRLFTYFYSNNFLGHLPTPLLLAIMALLSLPFAGLSLSATMGIWLFPRGRPALLLFFLFTGYLLPHVFILSEERFHLALIPFLAILAALFWTSGRVAVKSISPAALTFSLLLMALLLFNWYSQFATEISKFITLLGPLGNQMYLPY